MINRVFNNPEIMHYAKNSAWMLAEYGLKVISAIFVTIYVARYIGPEKFGILSYALAVVAIFMTISRLGMESILVRDLTRYPEERQAYLSTAFGLMFFAAISSILVLAGLVFVMESDQQTKLYIWIISASILFQTFLVIDYNFQSQVQAKYASTAKALALCFSAISKLVLVWQNAELVYFAVFYAFDHLVVAIFLFFMHLYRKQPVFFTHFKKHLIKPLLSSAWPMILSSLATILYMRIDQIMVKNILGMQELGIYSAAAKLYEGWIIVPFVFSMSILPMLIKARESSQESFEEIIILVFRIVFYMGVVVTILVLLLGDLIINLTFGKEYQKAAIVMVLMFAASSLSAIGFVSARYLTVMKLERKILIRTLVALMSNILLNIWLIPIYGILGAAASTFFSLLLSNYIIDFFDTDLRDQVRLKNKAILFKG